MGNSQSSPSKNETRRANRLSKPLTKKPVALGSPQLPQLSFDQSELSGGLVGWHNPWGDSAVSRDIRYSYPRAREIPPPLFETDETSHEDSLVNETWRGYPSSHSLPPSPGSLSASPSVRRASYQSGPAGSSSQSSLAPDTPKRANSIQTPLSRHGSILYEDSIKDATSSNTHFLVGNQRFSLTRRRSLLTRPGVATRRTTSTISRIPSPIGEPESPVDGRPDSVHWPLPPRRRPPLSIAPPARPTSPADARYTQLGALKLGSLRVVNGSASPCPSERLPLTGSCPAGPGLGLENVGVMCPSATMLEIPAVVDIKNSDDVPGSPFSFEKSPILAVHIEPKAVFSGDVVDEGIGMCDDNSVVVGKNAMDAGIDRSTSRSLNKSDSGYSSAASVRSIPRSRTRASRDSQESSFCAIDKTGSSDLWISDDRLGAHPGHQVQRHLSLQEARPGNYSRLHPTSPRWHESSGPHRDSWSNVRPRRSTLGATKYNESPRSTDVVVPGATQTVLGECPYSAACLGEQSVMIRDSIHSETTACDPNALNARETPAFHHRLPSIDTNLGRHRSASECRVEVVLPESVLHRSRSRSRAGSRVWCQVPGIEVPPLPTIFSPDRARAETGTGDEYFPPEPCRGRPRSRSHDNRRRKLTRAQPVFI